MKTTYLKEFVECSLNGVAYIPVGTIEWHGEHLPVETDFMVAQKICELLSKRINGYVLPPIYLGTDKSKKIGEKNFIGMDRHLKKRLPGSIYYLKPTLFYKVMESLVENLIRQNCKKIIIITGHAGSKQLDVLEKIEQAHREVISLNPYSALEHASHAGIEELSLFLALYPSEANKILKIKIPKNNDCFAHLGYDPRERVSLALGKKILKQVMEDLLKKMGKIK